MADCEFCAEFAVEGRSWREVIRFSEMILAPGLGCFVEGYTLLIPVRHVRAFADLTERHLAELQDGVENVRAAIERFTRMRTIVAEHGATVCDVGASCVDHAHLHFIPVIDVAAFRNAYIDVGGPPKQGATLADLVSQRGSSYVYLSTGATEHLTWHADPFTSQFARRVATRQHGCPDEHDWRTNPFPERMASTHDALRSIITQVMP